MDENELDNIDDVDEDSYTDPSGRGSIDREEPKNPNTTEAFMVVLVLGVLPDVIDFFSIGAFSTFSSMVSWPLTEYYFHHKNLEVPNVKKWMRGMNIGDAVPVLGVLPLKTIGLLIAIYMAWHPDSAITKAATAADVAAGGTKQAVRNSPGSLKRSASRDIAKSAKEWVREKAENVKKKNGGDGEEESTDGGFELAYRRPRGEEDVYGEISEGGQQISSPEEQAETEVFGETVSTPPQEEEAAPPPKRLTTNQVQPTSAPTGQPGSSEIKKKEEERDEAAKVGGAYVEEAEIMATMKSAGGVEDILKEKPRPLNSLSNPQEVKSSNDEKVVDLS